MLAPLRLSCAPCPSLPPPWLFLISVSFMWIVCPPVAPVAVRRITTEVESAFTIFKPSVILKSKVILPRFKPTVRGNVQYLSVATPVG